MPLYILVIIRCYSEHRCRLIGDFFSELFHGNIGIIGTALTHSQIFAIFLMCFGLLLFILSLFVYFLFNNIQTYGFQEESKKIAIDDDLTENSVIFFVTYVTPFVLDNMDECRGFFSFATIIVLLLLLMSKTNLYYQNPFLTILGYRSFNFHFEGEVGKPKIGITRGKIDISNPIKQKLISDDVYLVYNMN